MGGNEQFFTSRVDFGSSSSNKTPLPKYHPSIPQHMISSTIYPICLHEFFCPRSEPKEPDPKLTASFAPLKSASCMIVHLVWYKSRHLFRCRGRLSRCYGCSSSYHLRWESALSSLLFVYKILTIVAVMIPMSRLFSAGVVLVFLLQCKSDFLLYSKFLSLFLHFSSALHINLDLKEAWTKLLFDPVKAKLLIMSLQKRTSYFEEGKYRSKCRVSQALNHYLTSPGSILQYTNVWIILWIQILPNTTCRCSCLERAQTGESSTASLRRCKRGWSWKRLRANLEEGKPRARPSLCQRRVAARVRGKIQWLASKHDHRKDSTANSKREKPNC